MFSKLASANGNFNKLLLAINSHDKVSVFGFTDNEKVSILQDVNAFFVYVVPTILRGEEVVQQLSLLGKRAEFLKDSDSPQFSQFAKSSSLHISSVINKIENDELDCVVVLSDLLLNKYLPKQNYDKFKLALEVGKNYDLKDLAVQLTALGYKRADAVEVAGEFAARGDILDVFSHNSSFAQRLSFFGDELEFVKTFNAQTQNMLPESHDYCEVLGKVSNNISDHDLEHAKKAVSQHASVLKDDVKENFEWVASQVLYEGQTESAWLSAFNSNINTSLLKLFPTISLLVFDDQKLVHDKLHQFLQDFANTLEQDVLSGKLLPEHKKHYFSLQEALSSFAGFAALSYGSIDSNNRLFTPHKVFNIRCLNIPSYYANRDLFVYDVSQFSKQGYTVVVFAGSAEYAKTLEKQLQVAGVPSLVHASRTTVVPQTVNIVSRQSNETFAVLEEKLVIIGTAKLLQKVAFKHKPKQSLPVESFTDSLPKEGDYVVHEVHGIGVCVGIQKINIQENTKDYLVLEYKNNDKLFVPVENLDSVSKYIGGNDQPTLNKLGGVEFYRTKQKVRKELQQTAEDLVALYSQRMEQQGIEFAKDDELQLAFESEFPYEETPDQLKVIEEIKQDMQSSKVMDRLLCGDVGYGKTEVAMRAMFKAVASGYQVALLCPTTILSQQHYNTIVSRMQNFGIKVEVLNRFKSTLQQKDALKKLKDGNVDVIIGTHRLLSADVKFKKLGLLVLDEEQKFGVADKEKIKKIKSNVDVLTLSATPIPRSLHMSLVGIRDISIIETPPPQKLPVNTSVVQQNDKVIKDAIEFELARNGQVLLVFNNVFNIYNFYTKIKKLIGEDVSIGVAHGQMTESELEKAIANLYNQNTQVLISTTLIENGIDLPLANTLVVMDADRLGLSQLYQLKGRVGRSTLQSYAYFLYDTEKVLNENAVKRLQAIAEYTMLGDGYKIAMKDLEIRGAGNVLGLKQHGHMQKVGYSLYVKLLKDTVSQLQGKKVEENYDVLISSEFNANLPNYYVEGTASRMKIYSEIAKISSDEDINNLLTKLNQNYGQVPEEIVNLSFVAKSKNLAKTLPIKTIKIRLREIVLEFLKTTESLNEGFLNFAKKHPSNIVLNTSNLPIITLKGFSDSHTAFELLENFLLLLQQTV